MKCPDKYCLKWDVLVPVKVLLFMVYQFSWFSWVGQTMKFGYWRKEISIDVYTENLKTKNSRVHERVFFPNPRIKALSLQLKITCKLDLKPYTHIAKNNISKGLISKTVTKLLDAEW